MSLGKIVAIILIFQRLYRRCYHCHLWRSLRLGFIFRKSVETDESLTCSCDWFLLVWTCQKSFNPCTSWMASFRLHSALTLRAYFIMKYSFPLHRSISLSISRLSRLILLKSHPIAEVLAKKPALLGFIFLVSPLSVYRPFLWILFGAFCHLKFWISKAQNTRCQTGKDASRVWSFEWRQVLRSIVVLDSFAAGQTSVFQ